jgi:hypothetical protein
MFEYFAVLEQSTSDTVELALEPKKNVARTWGKQFYSRIVTATQANHPSVLSSLEN